MKVIEAIEKDTLFNLWHKTKSVCETSKKISNLIITGTFPFTEINSEWIQNFKGKAKEWQDPIRPNHLVLNHGEYIDRYKKKFDKSGLEYIIEELKTKADSNRACWSLFDMNTLIDSGDKSIPSFIVLQVGISDDNKTLLMTAYYRALEVSKFLPINIAESCLIAEELQKAFSYQFEKLSLTIHTFNGYSKEHFSCLEKAEIDLLDEGDIMLEIMSHTSSKKWISERLSNKKETKESRIIPDGIDLLLKSIEKYNLKSKKNGLASFSYSQNIILGLESISKNIKEYNSIVYSSTYADEAKAKYDEIIDYIDKILDIL